MLKIYPTSNLIEELLSVFYAKVYSCLTTQQVVNFNNKYSFKSLEQFQERLAEQEEFQDEELVISDETTLELFIENTLEDFLLEKTDLFPLSDDIEEEEGRLTVHINVEKDEIELFNFLFAHRAEFEHERVISADGNFDYSDYIDNFENENNVAFSHTNADQDTLYLFFEKYECDCQERLDRAIKRFLSKETPPYEGRGVWVEVCEKHYENLGEDLDFSARPKNFRYETEYSGVQVTDSNKKTLSLALSFC